MRREWFFSIGAVVLAFLGSQHHALMLLLLAIGLGDAGMSLMAFPLLRDVMLALSVVMAAVLGFHMAKPRRPRAMRIAGAASVLITLGLSGWSVLHFGL